MDRLEQLLKDSLANHNDIITLDNEFLSLFPLNSIESIKALNNRILNNDHDIVLLMVNYNCCFNLL